jgi:hypothetical protein
MYMYCCLPCFATSADSCIQYAWGASNSKFDMSCRFHVLAHPE